MGDRKNINVTTLDKVRQFLKKQESPVFISDIVKKINVDFYSAKLAISLLNVRTNKDGKIKLKC